MTPQFQKTLEGNKFADNPSIRPEPFSVKLIDLNITMLAANSRISGKAPYSSRWYTWPLMLRPVFYWQIPYTNFIYYLGNPLVYWLGTLSMAISICAMAWIVLRRKPRSGNIGIQFFVVAGYLVNYLPFIFIGRVMFLYHYEAALVFSIIAMAYLLECTFVSKTWRRSLFAILAIVCIVSFIYFSPLTYGTHLTNDELQSRMWLSTWR